MPDLKYFSSLLHRWLALFYRDLPAPTSKYGNHLFNGCTTAIFEKKYFFGFRTVRRLQKIASFSFLFQISPSELNIKEYFRVQGLVGEMDADNSGNLDASDHQNSSHEGKAYRQIVKGYVYVYSRSCVQVLFLWRNFSLWTYDEGTTMQSPITYSLQSCSRS